MSKPTTTVIGRVKNRAGALVEVTKTVLAFRDIIGEEIQEVTYGWRCNGCADSYSSVDDNQQEINRKASCHAKGCAFEPTR